MKKNTLLLLAVSLITLIGGFLRFYKITQNPPSLTGDEISLGYAAYSVLKTAHDEHGKFLPLTFESIGDYKNPVPAYLMVPTIKIFGLDEFAVKFPDAFFGTLSIPLFFIFLVDIFKKKKIALVGSLFLAISIWHIFYSRISYGTLTAGFFVFLGVWFFIKMLRGRIVWAFLSALFLSLTMYTAPAPRLFVPIFVLGALIVSLPRIKKNIRPAAVFIGSCAVLGLPMLYTTLFQGSGARLSAVFISHDIEFIRYILLKYFDSPADIPLLFFFWIKRYLSYFDPGFLFFNGLDATVPVPIGLGVLYVFEIPLLIAGIIGFIKYKIQHKELFVVWIFAGLLPDSITNNLKHTGRLIHIFPIIYMLTSIGAIELYSIFKRIKKPFIRISVLIASGIFIILVLTHAFLVYTVDFPRDKGEYYDEGLKEVALYVGRHQDSYKEIVIDPRHGVSAQDMVSNPFLYILFYLKYDPKTYQTEPKVLSTNPENPYYHFNKYTFRHINWQEDRLKKGVLFIGSPWSFPKEGLPNAELLHVVYLTGGDPAYYMVTPK